MQRNKNAGLLILLIVLMISTTLAYVWTQGEDRVIVDPGMFRVTDPLKIDRVTLESDRGKIDLHFDGTQWRVNARHEADRNLIDVLFATLEKAVPKRPVAEHLLDSINRRVDKSGTVVSLFEGTVLQKRFRVGTNALLSETYFRADQSAEPYLVTIPGYRVKVYPIFELDENGWRDKRIFNFSWRNFKSLTADFPSDLPSRFEIGRQDKIFSIIGLDKSDTARINTFLDDVSLLVADQIVPPGSSQTYDSLVKTTPVMSIQIADIAHREYRLNLYAPLAGDSRVAGKALDNEIVLFDRKRTFRILKKRNYFRMK